MSRFDIFFVMTDDCREAVDMAIAKRIVSLHKDMGSNRDVFEIEDQPQLLNHASMLRYLTFARQIAPKITPEAKQLLIKVYQRMRTNEFQIQKSAYRITVRQLESLIRLSEACAKVECSFEVTERHVQEAVQLLNNSIVKVDTQDFAIQIEEALNEEVNKIFQEELERDLQIQRQAAQVQEQQPLKEEAKQSMKLTREEYKKISQSLIQIMKEMMIQDPNQKITPDLLSLHLIESQLNDFTEIEQMKKQEKIIRGVIRRMIDKERLLQMLVDENGSESLRFHPSLAIQQN